MQLSLTADSTSWIAIGPNSGISGSVLINSPLTVTGAISAPSIDINSTVTDIGSLTLSASGAGVQTTASGHIDIGQGSSLTIDGVDLANSDNVPNIAFTGEGGTLVLVPSDLNAKGAYRPAITGFDSSDTIFFAGTVTRANYAAGLLTLMDGDTPVAQLTLSLSSSASGGSFSVLPLPVPYDGVEGTDIVLRGNVGQAPAAAMPNENFTWAGPVSGLWGAMQNWNGGAADRLPTALPGANDTVTIGAAPDGGIHVVTGDGNASKLLISGETLLVGTFGKAAPDTADPIANLLVNSGSLVLQTGSTVNATAVDASGAGLGLDGGVMNAQSFVGGFNTGTPDPYAISNSGAFYVSNLNVSEAAFGISSLGKLVVSGDVDPPASPANPVGHSDFTVDGGTFSVAGTLSTWGDTINASGGGAVEIHNLQEGTTGGGVTLSADATSSIEIGWSPGATTPQGAITIDFWRFDHGGRLVLRAVHRRRRGADGRGGREFSLNGALSGNGGITVGAGASFSLDGQLSLGGTITLDAGATLTIVGAAPASPQTKIAFSPGLWTPGSSGEAVILDSSDFAGGTFAPSITGVDPTEVIDYARQAVTGAAYSAGVLTLYDGPGSVVGTLNVGLATNDSNPTFAAIYVPTSEKSQIVYLGGAPAPQVNEDSLSANFVWNGPYAGDWDTTSNWDVTSNGVSTPATASPGALDSVTIGAAPNGGAYAIVGNGAAESLTLEGATLLDGAFSVADGLTLNANASLVLQNTSSKAWTGAPNVGQISGSLTAGSADLSASDTGLVLDGGTLTVNGGFAGGANIDNPNSYVIEDGGELSVLGAFVADRSEFSVSTGGLLEVAGNVDGSSSGGGSQFNISDGTFGVAGTFTSLGDTIDATGGAVVGIHALQEGSGSNTGIALSADAASSIEIGWSGSLPLAPAPSSPGSITIDSGVSITEAGSFSAPSIVDDGELTVGAGESLSLNGALSGNGGITVGAGASSRSTASCRLTARSRSMRARR